MVIKRSIGENIFDSVNVIIIAILSFIFIYPLLFCLFASLSDPRLLAGHSGPLFIPLGFTLTAYKSVFTHPLIMRGLLNTIFYVIVGTTLQILMTSLAAYVLTRKGFYWRNLVMFIIVFTMYFGGGLIPYYLLVVNTLHLNESPWAIILPSAASAFNIIIMRTYFATIPDSMEESAVLDGANDITILFRIILPLAKPVVAVMVIYYGVANWNSWFPAMLFLLRNRDWQPLQLLLRDILNANNANNFVKNPNPLEAQQYARLIQYALIVITVIPIMAIYPFMQEHFIKGVMIGSIKE